MSLNKREYSLDLIRSIATILVIINHSVEAVFHFDIDSISSMSLFEKTVAFSCLTVGRIGVPLFLFLSGYLLLDRTYDKKRIKRFYYHNFMLLLVVWEIWIILYQLYLAVHDYIRFNPIVFLKKIFLIKDAGMTHTWYGPMIIGLYLFIPFIGIALSHMNKKMICGLLLVTFIWKFVFPNTEMLFVICGLKKTIEIENQLELSFSGGVYGFYLILGYVLKKYNEDIKKMVENIYVKFGIAAVVSMLFASTVLIQMKMYECASGYNVWYDFCTIPIMSIVLFIGLKSVKIKFLSIFITELSRDSFGVFLVHVFFVNAYAWRLEIIPSIYIRAMLLVLLVFVSSLLLVSLLGRSKIGGVLFLRK